MRISTRASTTSKSLVLVLQPRCKNWGGWQRLLKQRLSSVRVAAIIGWKGAAQLIQWWCTCQKGVLLAIAFDPNILSSMASWNFGDHLGFRYVGLCYAWRARNRQKSLGKKRPHGTSPPQCTTVRPQWWQRAAWHSVLTRTWFSPGRTPPRASQPVHEPREFVRELGTPPGPLPPTPPSLFFLVAPTTPQELFGSPPRTPESQWVQFLSQLLRLRWFRCILRGPINNPLCSINRKIVKSNVWCVKINACVIGCDKLINLLSFLHGFLAECVSRDLSRYAFSSAITVLQKEELGCSGLVRGCLCLGTLA